jgi:hypothetical protein
MSDAGSTINPFHMEGFNPRVGANSEVRVDE